MVLDCMEQDIEPFKAQAIKQVGCSTKRTTDYELKYTSE